MTTRDQVYAQIGKNIAELRKAAGFSQESLAEKADCSVSFLAHLEAGRKKPSLDMLISLAEAFSEPLSSLIPGPDGSELPSEFVRSVRKLSREDLLLLGKLARRMRSAKTK